jgi:multidrug efflux system membrane fusion protein
MIITEEPSQKTLTKAPGAPATPATTPETPAGTPIGTPPRQDEPSSAPPPEGPRPARQHRWWAWALVVVAAALAVYLLLPRGSGNQATSGSGKAGQGGTGAAPVPVVAAVARTGDIGVYLTGLGNVTALNTAVVKSRVDGQLLRVDFHEGQLVRQGELLAELDPRPFQVQLMQARGQKAKDEAALQNARVDLQRYQVLIQEDSVPRQQLDTQAATVKQFEAAIESDQAQVESAQLNLTYSRVTAPIAGRAGLRLVDTGNIVHASDANGIVMVNQVQPITVIFTIPADRLPPVLQQMHAGRQLPVDAFDRDNKTKLGSGVLAAVDNQIDQTTGTVRLRAVFPNPEDALFPSQFVNARLLVDTLRGAVLVPNAAIQRSPTATFVYLVQPDHTVAVRNVEVQLTEGDTSAIRSGLGPGNVVVTDGVDRLRPGMKVTATTADASPGAATNPNAPNAPNPPKSRAGAPAGAGQNPNPNPNPKANPNGGAAAGPGGARRGAR